ncbi:MAG: hypothetical protein [Olavius algarvensis Delta 4 endosymbiont]|nr:MAG: hypothetical protein [Olavius algarvensis Delta 4 endosymbiont]
MLIRVAEIGIAIEIGIEIGPGNVIQSSTTDSDFDPDPDRGSIFRGPRKLRAKI